jgi:hypothetical protein
MNIQHRTSNVEPRLGVVAPLRNFISFVFIKMVGLCRHLFFYSTLDVGRSMLDVHFLTNPFYVKNTNLSRKMPLPHIILSN